MRKKLETLITAKQKSTIAIALSIANDKELLKSVEKKSVSQNSYNDLIVKFNKNTLYKNIWIQIFDANITSIYKSWDNKKGENKKSFRQDIRKAIEQKKPLYSINSGAYDLSIRSIVPLFSAQRNIGAIELISHFNSISKELYNFDIESVVVLKKEQNKYLRYPFTKIFIGDYYVANFDAPASLREHLAQNGVKSYFNSGYKVQNNYLIVPYELKNMDSDPIGYFIMFKKLDAVSNKNLDYFMLQWFLLSAFGIFIFVTILGVMIYYKTKRQKKYYKNIIDSSSNIVMVLSQDAIIDVNKVFFQYFYKYTTLKEFQKKHRSIADFFVQEEGFVYKSRDGKNWFEYVLQHPNDNQVKIVYEGKEYYFSIGLSLISAEEGHYSAIFSDITKEKVYQKKLEHISRTDPLTKIKNRYCYAEQLQIESTKAKRYAYPLSLVIFDIDYFKQVNDEHGHGAGDAVLIEYTKLIGSYLRESDIFCRIGGEEFALILPHTDSSGAYNIAEKLRIKVQKHKKIIPITMSFGVTEYSKGEDLEVMFKRADDALYEAKKSGRNKAVVR